MKNKNKIVTNLWFNIRGGHISKIIDYYKSIFFNDLECGPIIPLGKTPSGNTEMCHVTLFGRAYVFMCTAVPHHPLNDAVSLILNCKDQKEIDQYWNYFTREGEESQCGWCIDKYGLRWQILPKNLAELMSRKDSFKVMMGQKKIVIKDYLH
jgi:predicted 3-demethylubiquinone-9 3-methyltransferase (glyoxalase superfamily)